jgi:hypothetical protein
MREHLLGFLVGALEPDEHDAVEAELRGSSDLKRALDELRVAAEPLSWDQQHYAPPDGLAARTVDYVSRRKVAIPIREFGGRTTRWSLQDFAVAASILIAASFLFFPAVSHSRMVARIAQCGNNLRQIGWGLQQYSLYHNGYAPSPSPTGNLASSAAFAPQMVAAGLMPDTRVLRCPESPHNSGKPLAVPTLAQIERAVGKQLQRFHNAMGGDYRGALGYMDDQNQYHPVRHASRPYFALVSDAPSVGRGDHQSGNHGGSGQNVLFEDGHVEFLKTCRCMPAEHPDDIFKNSDGLVAPGHSPDDSVIAPGSFSLVDFEQAGN